MLEFAHPLAFLLALPLAALLWRWHVRRRPALRFSSLALFEGLPAGRAPWSERGGLVLRALALAALIGAVAGPRWPDPGSRVPTQALSLALVIDVSFSMKNEDFLADGKLTSRWAGVQKIARLFLRGGEEGGVRFVGRPHDLVALVTFARRPETDCPLTLDHDALLTILDAEAPRALQPTNPGDALVWGLHFLEKAPTRHKAIVFLTDGEDNVKDGALRPWQAAGIAAAMGVPIHAIEIEPLPDESRSKESMAARKMLEEVARLSSGTFHSASDAQGLLGAWAAIDAMERDRIESFEYRRYRDADHWFALAALAVVVLTVVLEVSIWRVGP